MGNLAKAVFWLIASKLLPNDDFAHQIAITKDPVKAKGTPKPRHGNRGFGVSQPRPPKLLTRFIFFGLPTRYSIGP